MRDRRQRATIAIGWLALLLLWEVAGRLQWVADGALPSPSGVLRQLVEDWDDYPPHIWATVRTSLIGFLVGNAFCGNPDYLTDEHQCSDILKPNYDELFNTACQGQSECKFNMAEGLIDESEWPARCRGHSTQVFI